MMILSILSLFLAVSCIAIIIIVFEERKLSFWRSSLKTWSKVWKISLWGALAFFWMHGILSVYHAVKMNFSNLPIPFTIIILFSIGFIMIFWLIIWNLRFDWWNAGARWQRILIGSSFIIATILLIVAAFL